jgi:hypothetical protein
VPFRPEYLTLRLVALHLVFLVSAATAVAQSTSSPSSVDLPGFVREMDRLADVIGDAQARDASQILTTIPHAYRVRDGQRAFDVPFEWFARRLAAARDPKGNWTSQREEMAADLRVIRAEAAALLAGSTPSPDPQAALAAILSRREFASRRNAEWSENIRRQITAWLERIWKSLGGDRLNSRTTAFVLACVAILIGTVSLAVWLIRRAAPTAGLPRQGLESGPALSSHAWALRAIAAARNGETHEAARCGYRAALRRLEEQGIWQIEESRTAREYLQLLKPDDPKRDLFGTLVRRFELAWFARRTLTRDDLTAVGDSLERLGCLGAHERAI